MSLFGVTEKKEQALKAQMAEAGLLEADLQEKFVRSSGHGGQNANKTSTCVYLKHLPSGIEVKVDRERVQGLNRFLARRQLLEHFRKEVLGCRTETDERLQKIRKQKRRRARRSQSKSKSPEPPFSKGEHSPPS